MRKALLLAFVVMTTCSAAPVEHEKTPDAEASGAIPVAVIGSPACTA